MKLPSGRAAGIFYFMLPLIVSAFTYFWNSANYPLGPSNDEGIYIRRAMHVLSGFGPQESLLYDHPYFSQIFMAVVFSIINYPNVLNPTVDSVESIKMIFFVPRTIMATIALVDTALVYMISKYWYKSRTIAITASTLFAVMPFADPIRRVLLESIQLPFFLSSILFAICATKKINTTNSNGISARQILFVVLSGTFLGLAIFTKIPIFTMIPLIVFIIYKSNKIKRVLALWILPVIIVPSFWPLYALYKNQLNLWFNGIYFQTHRGVQTFFEIIKYHFQYDPILVTLGLIGIAFSTIKKDLFILIWTVPFFVFLYAVGFVSYWHIVPLIPLFCIAAARLIYDLSQLIPKKNIQKILPFLLLFIISFYSIHTYTEVIMASNNSTHFELVAFIVKYLYDDTHIETNNKDKIVLISNPFYSWIPKYAFNLNNYQAVDYLDNVSVNANKVLMILDSQWENRAKNNMLGAKMVENYKTYGKNKIATFGENVTNNQAVSIYAFDSNNRKTPTS
ncbi:MAG: hypothetical protein H0X50_02215 [Nitrosopumilus sp.]|nr:hypothetical protein [Nitrosopumilus sp.]